MGHSCGPWDPIVVVVAGGKVSFSSFSRKRPKNHRSKQHKSSLESVERDTGKLAGGGGATIGRIADILSTIVCEPPHSVGVSVGISPWPPCLLLDRPLAPSLSRYPPRPPAGGVSIHDQSSWETSSLRDISNGNPPRSIDCRLASSTPHIICTEYSCIRTGHVYEPYVLLSGLRPIEADDRSMAVPSPLISAWCTRSMTLCTSASYMRERVEHEDDGRQLIDTSRAHIDRSTYVRT